VAPCNASSRFEANPHRRPTHWLTVILVAVAWALGLFGDDLPNGAGRAAGLFVHISAGLAVMVLLVFRLAWNLANRPPRRTDRARRLGRSPGARGSLSALWAADRRSHRWDRAAIRARDAVSIFGIADISSPWVRDRAFARSVKEVHEILAHTLMIVASLHAAAALFHHWVLRDRTLARMLPRVGG
jgi:cytochrome b561